MYNMQPNSVTISFNISCISGTYTVSAVSRAGSAAFSGTMSAPVTNIAAIISTAMQFTRIASFLSF